MQVKAVEAAHRGNRGSCADIVTARPERQQLQDRTDEAQVTEASAKAMLRRWVGDASSHPPAASPRLDVSQWLDALDDVAIDILPDVVAVSAQAAMADTEERASRATKTPDVTVELTYSQRRPAYANMVSSNVSLSIPWDQKNRQDREVPAKLAQVNAARTRAEVLRRNMVGWILGKRKALRLNQRRPDRYQTTIVLLARA